MVPLLLQVQSQLADVWASLLSTLACNKAGAVLLRKAPRDRTAAPGRYACLEFY